MIYSKLSLKRLTLILLAIIAAGPAHPERSSGGTTGIEISMTKKPAFPRQLVSRGINAGLATIALSVDEYGILNDWLVVEATDRSLEGAIEAVIGSWEFRPATADGRPTAARQLFPVYFDASPAAAKNHPEKGDLFHVNYADPTQRAPSASKRSRPLLYASIKELDSLPRLLHYVNPSVAPEEYKASLGTSLGFDFYLDRDGRVRMPTLKTMRGEANEAAIYAAQTALEQWRFEPVTKEGRPVMTKLGQTITFSHIYR